MGMNLEVFTKCIKVLELNYDKLNVTSDIDKLMLWYDMLGNRNEIEFMLGVKKHIATNTFAPTIACLNKAMASNIVNNAPDGLSAWAELQSAIRKWGMYHEGEALDSLSPETRAVVNALGFTNLCTSENQMADRAHFIKLYESRACNNKERETVGDKLSGMITQVANKTAMLGGGAEWEG